LTKSADAFLLKLLQKLPRNSGPDHGKLSMKTILAAFALSCVFPASPITAKPAQAAAKQSDCTGENCTQDGYKKEHDCKKKAPIA